MSHVEYVIVMSCLWVQCFHWSVYSSLQNAVTENIAPLFVLLLGLSLHEFGDGRAADRICSLSLVP